MKKSKILIFALSATMALAPVQTALAATATDTLPAAPAMSTDLAVLNEDDAADLIIDLLTDDFEDEIDDDFINDESAEEIFEEETVESETLEIPDEALAGEKETETETEEETETETEDKFEAEPVDLSEYENIKVAQFIVNMYQRFLQRNPEPAGLKHWYEQLTTGKTDGAAIVEQFINSNEFLARDLSTDAFLNALYQGILGRSADANGKAYWVNVLKKGVSRNYVAANFVASNEFKRFCETYGIEYGTFPLKEARDQDIKLTEWVNGFYQNCLDRNGDAKGLNYWTGHLLDHSFTGANLVEGFMFSNECVAKDLYSEEFINTLYKTVLGRSADPKGMDHWMTCLDNGVSRKYITAQVVKSTEYAKKCNQRGIELGGVYLSEERDQNYALTSYCTNIYKEALSRKPSVSELNKITGKCLTKNITHVTLPSYIFNSSEYINLNTSNEEFITDVFYALLKRRPTGPELNIQMDDLQNKYDLNRGDFLHNIIGSKEYIGICKNNGVPIGTNQWGAFGNKTFYYGDDGCTYLGWLHYNGNRYYLDPESAGAMFNNGWIYIDGYKFFFYESGIMATDLDNIIGPQSSYFMHVYKWGNYVIVFAKDGDNGYIIPCKVMICSCGVNTPTGYYWTPATYRWLTMVGGSKAQWCTQIYGDYLFHSVPYVIADNTTLYNESMYNKLGTTQSLGCIRLQAGFAKWVYDHCGAGTQVYIDPYNDVGPFDKPYFEPVESWHTWDPTDPTAQYLCKANGCEHHIVMP